AMMTDPGPIRVTALYRFTAFADPEAYRAALSRTCNVAGIRGTLLLAREGINGTIAGDSDAIDSVLADIRALPGCADLEVKDAWADAMPFHRMKVRIKQEIVTMGEPDVDP